MTDGPNLYIFCNNNSVNFIDLWGLCGEKARTGWFPPWFNWVIPVWGFYGGPGISGQNFTQLPYGLQDAVYMWHDLNYRTGNFDAADRQLVRELAEVRPKSINELTNNILHYDSRMLPNYILFRSHINYNLYGELYRESARMLFSIIIKIRESYE